MAVEIHSVPITVSSATTRTARPPGINYANNGFLNASRPDLAVAADPANDIGATGLPGAQATPAINPDLRFSYQPISPISEPFGLSFLAAGLAGLGFFRMRDRRRALVPASLLGLAIPCTGNATLSGTSGICAETVPLPALPADFTDVPVTLDKYSGFPPLVSVPLQASRSISVARTQSPAP